jgi:hypothetical protein
MGAAVKRNSLLGDPNPTKSSNIKQNYMYIGKCGPVDMLTLCGVWCEVHDGLLALMELLNRQT